MKTELMSRRLVTGTEQLTAVPVRTTCPVALWHRGSEYSARSLLATKALSRAPMIDDKVEV